MNDPIAVEARFEPDGSIQPLSLVMRGVRIRIASVGRQWDEADGRHILVMSETRETAELVYAPKEASWKLHAAPPDFGSPRATT